VADEVGICRTLYSRRRLDARSIPLLPLNVRRQPRRLVRAAIMAC
jgi:hypothetical protein